MGLPFVTQVNPMKANAQSGLIKSWSITSLEKYLECEYWAFLKYVRKIKVILSEEEEQKQNEAKDRGSLLHATIEDFITGVTDKLPKSIKHRRETIEAYREFYDSEKRVCIEEEWAFSPTWEEVPWRSEKAWNRTKIDAMVFETEESAIVDDWKSGKKYGNEGKHMRQLMSYITTSFLKFPKLKFVRGNMQYIDIASDNLLTRKVSREAAMNFLTKLENQALAMTTATKFRPCPNLHNCKFCEFSNRIPNTNERYCEYAIVDL